jgi:hypothetical protein
MADVKISALPVATTPLDGTELVPIVQSGVTEQVTVANLTAGRSVAASALVVSANSADTLVRFTQTGAGNALLVEDSANPDATPFVVTAAGKLIVGATTLQNPRTGRTAVVEVNAVNVTTEDGLALTKWANTSTGNAVVISRSRGTTVGTQVIVSNNDVLSEIFTQGSDGTQFIPAATIAVAVDGTPGVNDMPGRLVFSTTADGAAAPTERMRITSAGNIVAGGSAALATTASNGFLYVPTCAGTPTGTPTTITGMAPIVVDTTNNKLYFYSNSAWRDAGP